jgi:outer membrane lipoprotein-sorting protein
MKTVLFLFLSVLFVFGIRAQQDPEAKKILDKAAEKTRSLKTIQADFKLTIDDRKEGLKNESDGKITIKGDKYVMESLGTKIFFDGKTMWTYVKDIEEVTITEPDMDDEDFLSNPAKILTWYDRDFKYRYVQETTINGIRMHEIDLFPKDLNQPYSRIKLFVGVNDLFLYSLKSVGKEGVDYGVTINNYVVDKDINDSQFAFDKNKYKKAEIVDMRL